MKTIFAKYNSERLPKYQIVTKIVVDDNGQKYAMKEALCNEANAHIEDIYNNYELLKNSYNLNLVKPTKIDNGLMFEMAQGISLENILLGAIAQNDKEKLTKYITKFLDFVDGMVTKRSVVFEPCEEFTTIFGEWENSEPQDIIKVANIDLIFGNIFVDEDENFTLIDYEWVFDFEVPKSYILWRSLAIFSLFNSIDLSILIEKTEKNNDKLVKYDEAFESFVCGIEKKYFLTQRVKKHVDFFTIRDKNTILNQNTHVIQLFFDHGNGFSEESSLKLPVAQIEETQEFVFDLSDKQTIKTLRLDPLNDRCVVNIEKIHLILDDESILSLKSYIQADACAHHGNSYFFESFDPQIYFHNLEISNLPLKSLHVEIQYNHIGNDALNVSVKQLRTELDNTRVELDQTKKSFLSKLLLKLQGKI